MAILNHVISTKNELLTSGFRIPTRPTHDGCDFVCNDRAELKEDIYILSIADGVVQAVRNGASVGWNVDIQHAGKILSRYMHMASDIKVKQGQTVTKGQIIGRMSNTGDVSPKPTATNPRAGTHLHIGIKEGSTDYTNGTYVDPMKFLTGEKTIGVIEPVKPDTSFKVGDKAAILLSAKIYATGQTIPAYVKGEKFTVQQVKDERILLKEIVSWVFIKDVQKC